MAKMISFLASLLLILAVSQNINAVDYAVTNRAANTPGGSRFNRDIGAQYSKQTMAAATSFIWRTFHQNSAADRKNVQKVSMFADDMGGVAYASVRFMLALGTFKITLVTSRERSLEYYTTRAPTFGNGTGITRIKNFFIPKTLDSRPSCD